MAFPVLPNVHWMNTAAFVLKMASSRMPAALTEVVLSGSNRKLCAGFD